MGQTDGRIALFQNAPRLGRVHKNSGSVCLCILRHRTVSTYRVDPAAIFAAVELTSAGLAYRGRRDNMPPDTLFLL